MKTHNFNNHVTVHDIGKELGRGRQTIMRWLRKLDIPFDVLKQGNRDVATFVDVKHLPKLREMNKTAARDKPDPRKPVKTKPKRAANRKPAAKKKKAA